MLNKYDKVSIRQSIGLSKNKKAQVKIEAELHACSVEEVLEVLGVNSVDELEHPKQGKLPPISPLQEPKPLAYVSPTKKSPIRSYNQAIKDDVVKAVLLEGLTQNAVAERYGIPFQTVSSWVLKAKKQRDGYINEATAIEKEVQAKQELQETKPASAVVAVKKPFVNQAFEKAVKEMADNNCGKKNDSLIKELDSGIKSLHEALAVFDKVGLMDIGFKEQLMIISIKAKAFREGFLYAGANAADCISDERSHQNLSLQKEHAPYLSSSWGEAIERAFGSVNNQFLDFPHKMAEEYI